VIALARQYVKARAKRAEKKKHLVVRILAGSRDGADLVIDYQTGRVSRQDGSGPKIASERGKRQVSRRRRA
jgi:hypothetical protein